MSSSRRTRGSISGWSRTTFGSSFASSAETGRSLDRKPRSPRPTNAPPAADVCKKRRRSVRMLMAAPVLGRNPAVGSESRPAIGTTRGPRGMMVPLAPHSDARRGPRQPARSTPGGTHADAHRLDAAGAPRSGGRWRPVIRLPRPPGDRAVRLPRRQPRRRPAEDGRSTPRARITCGSPTTTCSRASAAAPASRRRGPTWAAGTPRTSSTSSARSSRGWPGCTRRPATPPAARRPRPCSRAGPSASSPTAISTTRASRTPRITSTTRWSAA